ncbi:VOC family protein [Kineosporia babensis]|uniref:VOC family protein n=1 Tax=Kineosporia babensis TaxID=499548 RepID=A0A9X1NIN0_9ACTN|nr:VOC family protein [Kineosporia babensis]MCD5314461.1 VOC family protein [Kineosporia babensis]
MQRSPLADRINRIAYLVVNVSDAERSRAFYENLTPLRVLTSIDAPEQTFHSLGIAEGSFRGYALDDRSGALPMQVHLIEWTSPRPVGQAYPVFWHVGLAKMAFITTSARSKLQQLKGAGVEPSNHLIYRGYTSIQDPDGVIISFPAQQIEEATEIHETLIHTNPSVRDIERSMDFYSNVLGLHLASESVPPQPVESSQGPGSVLSQWDSHLYTGRAGGPFHIDLSQFHHPAPTPDTLTPYEQANNLGIARIGFEVDDIEACRAILGAGEIEEWDYGPGWKPRRTLCFRDPDGIRLELFEKDFTVQRHRSDGANPPPLDPQGQSATP